MRKLIFILLASISLGTNAEYYPGPYSSSPGAIVTKIFMQDDATKGPYYEITLSPDSDPNRRYVLGFPGTTHPGSQNEVGFNAGLSILLTSYSAGKPVVFYGGPSGSSIYIHRVSLVDTSR